MASIKQIFTREQIFVPKYQITNKGEKTMYVHPPK